MASGARERSREPTPPDSLVVACWRVAALAPGGFVLGHLAGRGLGHLAVGCPLLRGCGEPAPILMAIPVAILGMGMAAGVAASRVRRWWEGVAVLAVGIASTLVMVVLVGMCGAAGTCGRGLALGWLLVAVGVAVATLRRRDGLSVREEENQRR